MESKIREKRPEEFAEIFNTTDEEDRDDFYPSSELYPRNHDFYNKDLQLVIDQTTASRRISNYYFKKNRFDLVNTIIELLSIGNDTLEGSIEEY